MEYGAATLSTFTRIDENTGNEGAQGKGRRSEVAKYRYRAEEEGRLLNILYSGTGAGGGEIVLPSPYPSIRKPSVGEGTRYVCL